MPSSCSRRRFLAVAATGAAVGLSGWPRALLAAEPAAPAKPDEPVKPDAAVKPAAPEEEYGGFAMGIQSYTLRNFPADAMLDLVRRLGLTRVETYPAHFEPRSTPAQIEAMKKKTAERNIQINACGVIGFGRDVAANRRVFQFAKAAGIRNISADPSPDAFDSLDKLVEEFDIRIAIHNHGPGARYNKIDSVLKAIKGHHQSIGACADLGHYIRAGENPVDAIEQFKGRLYGVHLKDFAEAKGNARGVILGRGKLDLVGVFKALKEVQFPADGALSLEYEENPKNPIDDVKACLAAASEGAKKAAA